MRRFLALALLRPLHHRSFALLWVGQLLSVLGDMVVVVALAWLVYDLTSSPIAMSWVVVLTNLPMLALMLIGGVAGDMLPRQRIMLVTDLLRGFLMLAVAVLIVLGRLQLWHLLIEAVLFGVALAFFRPAYWSLLPQLVPKEELSAANSLILGSLSIANFTGPLVGVTLVGTVGYAGAFILDAASFGVSALCLLAIPVVSSAPSTLTRGIRAELAEGFRAVASTPWIWSATVIWSLANAIAAGSYMVLLPLLVRQRFAGEISVLGLVQSAVAVGVVLGMLVISQFGIPRRRGVAYYGGIIVQGLMMTGLGYAQDVTTALLFGLVSGLAGGMLAVVWRTSLQELVPQDLLGRVTSIDLLAQAPSLSLGSLCVGLVAEVTGASSVFFLGGLVVVVISSCGLLSSGARRFCRVAERGDLTSDV